MPVQLVEGCRNADGTVTDVPDATGTQVVSAACREAGQQMLEIGRPGRAGWPRTSTIPGYRVA